MSSAEFPTPWRVIDECDWHRPLIVDANSDSVVSGKVASVLHRIVAPMPSPCDVAKAFADLEHHVDD